MQPMSNDLLASAALDRLTHHAEILVICGLTNTLDRDLSFTAS